MLTRTTPGSKGGALFSPLEELQNLPKDLGGVVHFCFTPEDFHLFTDSFPKLKPELLALQVKKRFTDLGVTMDSSGFIHKSTELPGKNNVVSSIFIHDTDLNTNLPEISSLRGIRNCRLFPAAVSIAGLIKQVTKEAVLLFLLGEQFSHVLVVKNGVPLYNQSLAQTGPGQVEEALIPNAVDFARVTVRKDHDIEEMKITCLGKRRDSIQLGNLGIEEWQPDFSGVVAGEGSEDVLRYPHLFGAYFADPVYNFIPKDFSQIWQVQNVSRIAAIIAGTAAAALLAGWLYLQPMLENQKAEYKTMSSEIARQRGQISKRMPQTTMLNNFERLVDIRTGAKNDFRLDTLAENLSNALPAMVRVTELIIQRQTIQENDNFALPPGTEAGYDPALPDAAPGSGILSLPENLQKKPFTIALTCTSKGTYTEVTTRFEKSAVALSDVFGVENLTWNYREESSTGTLTCTLFPQQQGDAHEL